MNKSRFLEAVRAGCAPAMLHGAMTLNGKGGGGGGSDIMAYLAMQQQAAQAKEALDFSKTIYQENKPWVEETRRMSREAGEMQLGLMKDSKARGDEMWSRYRQLFAPIEDRVAKDALTAGSKEEQDRAAARAGADVEGAMGDAQAAKRRDMARMGLSVNDMQQDASMTALARGLGKAGAMTNAADRERMRGFAMREGAANFGRGFPSTAAQAQGIGMSAGMGAVNAAAAPIGALNTASAPHLQSQWNMANMYGQQAGIYASMYANREQEDYSGIWGALGQIGGMAAYKMLPMIPSDENLKKDKRPVSNEEALEGIRKVPVEKWKYKEGIEDSAEHIGPYAQDVMAVFGDQVAPEGEQIDLISMNGITMKGLQALAEKVEKIESKIGLKKGGK